MRYAPMEWVEDLSKWCDDIGIRFMASIFSQDALRLAESAGMQEYKIAHQVAQGRYHVDASLVENIIATNKPVYISGKIINAPNVYPLYVHSAQYPCYEPHMPEDFSASGWYGYSSHHFGVGDALLAIGRGAQFVEKHLTLDKTEESIKDNHFALGPDEFRDMVTYGNEIARALGHRPA